MGRRIYKRNKIKLHGQHLISKHRKSIRKANAKNIKRRGVKARVAYLLVLKQESVFLALDWTGGFCHAANLVGLHVRNAGL